MTNHRSLCYPGNRNCRKIARQWLLIPRKLFKWHKYRASEHVLYIKIIANNHKCTNYNMHLHSKPVWGDKSSMLFISLFKYNFNVFYTPTALCCISYYLTSYHISHFYSLSGSPKNGYSTYCTMYCIVFFNLHAVTYQQTYLFTAGIIQNSSTLFWT